VPWDFFYEHCSLFTAESLTLALELAGFCVTGVRHVFGGQYLWAEGEAGRVRPRSPSPLETLERRTGGVAALARAFAAEERERVTGWTALLAEAGADGPVFAWGAGAKGVTFCNLADPERTRLAGVVDVNPAKQSKYLPGTGHPIVPPEAVAGARAVLVFNPNYVAEVRATVARLGSRAEIIDPMQARVPCGLSSTPKLGP
jgi:hypothetical protein